MYSTCMFYMFNKCVLNDDRTGQTVSIEASPDLPGVSPKRRPPETSAGSSGAREWRSGGKQQKEIGRSTSFASK
jgi:hypothetical protein